MTSLPLPAHAARLRLLVLAVSDRCDQRCAHCQIWLGPPAAAAPSLTRGERLAIVEEAIALGVEEVLLTGGEPLLSADLWPIAERLATAGVRPLLATNGLLIGAFAAQLARLFAELYVSLDGAAATHDRLRGVPSFERLAAGLRALRAFPKRPLLVARATLHAENASEVEAIAASARAIGFDRASFLPLDAASDAFGGRLEERRRLVPTTEQVAAFEAAIARLARDHAGFVLESPSKLRRVAAHLRASGGAGAFARPECDAPWWSSVVEADGRLRPCFFHAPAGDARDGLRAARRARGYSDALARVRATNQTCERCVCPKRRGVPLRERLFG
jgi:MoaA/NifB/PqqE/SkfB family radical SAM enzyme